MRFGLSAVEKRDVWSRWKAGQTLHEIGRAYGKPHSCIRCLLLPRGGIPPATRRRTRLALTLAEREDISRGIVSPSVGGIAAKLSSLLGRKGTHSIFAFSSLMLILISLEEVVKGPGGGLQPGRE